MLDPNRTHQWKCGIRPQDCNFMESLQFAYQAQLGVDDAIIYLLHRAYSHLERPGNSESHVLCLLQCIYHHPASPAFEEERPVRCGDEQHRRTPRCSTFTIYASDFTFNSGMCHLQKFSDDSSIMGCISEDRGTGTEVWWRALSDYIVY